ncbi:MAG: MerR family transcriptional regulator [Christensenellales bacterium]|jgi:DNA-binding transcriptional MerR regulator
MSKRLLTIADMSRELNIPESTLRSWRDRFQGFIPTTGTGRKKRYKPEAVDVLRSIAEMSAEW